LGVEDDDVVAEVELSEGMERARLREPPLQFESSTWISSGHSDIDANVSRESTSMFRRISSPDIDIKPPASMLATGAVPVLLLLTLLVVGRRLLESVEAEAEAKAEAEVAIEEVEDEDEDEDVQVEIEVTDALVELCAGAEGKVGACCFTLAGRKYNHRYISLLQWSCSNSSVVRRI
jgi:hypothetical protein